MKSDAVILGGVIFFIGAFIGIIGYVDAESMSWLERMAYPDRYDSSISMAIVGGIIGFFGFIILIIGLAIDDKSSATIQTYSYPTQLSINPGFSPTNFTCPYCNTQGL